MSGGMRLKSLVKVMWWISIFQSNVATGFDEHYISYPYAVRWCLYKSIAFNLWWCYYWRNLNVILGGKVKKKKKKKKLNSTKIFDTIKNHN